MTTVKPGCGAEPKRKPGRRPAAGRRNGRGTRSGLTPTDNDDATPARSGRERTTGRQTRTADVPDLRPAIVPGSLDRLSLVSPPRPAPVSMACGPQPPAAYGDDRIVALARDPRCLYVYWELAGGGYREAERRHGAPEMLAGRWVLRVEQFREDCPRSRYFDVAVDPGAGNWYLHVEPSAVYRVRIGLVLPSGVFVDLAVTRLTATLPESVSSRTDGLWRMTREQFEQMMACAIGGGPAGSSRAAAGFGRVNLPSWNGAVM